MSAPTDRAAPGPAAPGGAPTERAPVASSAVARRASTPGPALRVTRGVHLAFGSLLILHLLSAGAAIGLLSRIHPSEAGVVEHALRALAALERAEAALADPTLLPEPRAREVNAALAVVRQQTLSADDRALLDAVTARQAAALAGDAAAVSEASSGLVKLAEHRRAEIEEATRSARRLSSAGAWVMSFLGVLSLTAGLLALRRFDRVVMAPLEELHGVIHDHTEGAGQRRGVALPGIAVELQETLLSLNRLLDSRAGPSPQLSRPSSAPAPLASADDRATLNALLDRERAPHFVIDADGSLVAANRAGLDLLTATPELRASLSASAAAACARPQVGSGSEPGVSATPSITSRLTATPLGEGGRVLVSYSA